MLLAAEAPLVEASRVELGVLELFAGEARLVAQLGLARCLVEEHGSSEVSDLGAGDLPIGPDPLRGCEHDGRRRGVLLFASA